jgi:trimethylamine:corrinoid methyltransferase-like protein
MAKETKYEDRVLGYSVFAKADIEKIHESSLYIMEHVGVKIPCPEAHRIYTEGGCSCDAETGIVYFPPGLVNELIEYVPETWLPAWS